MILVIASPRSGTTYASRFYRHQGLDLGHERLGTDGAVSWPYAVQADAYPSWMAGPHTPPSGRWEAVIHQTRHPLNVIASLSTIGNEAWQWMRQHTGPLDGDDLTRRCALYLAWVGICDRASEDRYQVERMANDWPRIAEMTGAPTHVLSDRARALSTTTNHRNHPPLTWAEVMRTTYGAAVRARAEEYGYDK